MEQNREPQPLANPVNSPPVYPPSQQPYYAPVQPIKAGRWTRSRRTARLLTRRAWYGSALLGRILRPFAVFIVVGIALLGVIGWMSYMLWGPRASSDTFTRATSLAPAPAVENYIKGQQNYNADLMWESYSTDYQASLLASGASKQTLQAQADSQRTRGLRYVSYDYIGGVQNGEGGSMYFYTIDLALSNQHARMPFVFTADADGKIVEVDSPFMRARTTSQ
jgi:hypothetical protein